MIGCLLAVTGGLARDRPLDVTALAWDHLERSHAARVGETTAIFTFRVTNTSSVDIAIRALHSTCGCTVAELAPLPERPRILAPQESAALHVRLDLAGKSGTLEKQVTVETSVGFQPLRVRASIPAAPFSETRSQNLATAAADRRAIFRGDCARCHAAPATGKHGPELYLAVCAICHEAHPRASMVPDLMVPRSVRSLAFWETWITHGAAGTLMPGFADSEGGPLTPAQIQSLVEYLHATYPDRPDAGPTASQPR